MSQPALFQPIDIGRLRLANRIVIAPMCQSRWPVPCRWPWHAATQLGGQVTAPEQYLRSQPRQFRTPFANG